LRNLLFGDVKLCRRVSASRRFEAKLGLGNKEHVGKYPFVNRTIKSWNQLPAGLLASFSCKINTFRKRVKNVVTSKGIQVGIECK
jgi:hypothetical protein